MANSPSSERYRDLQKLIAEVRRSQDVTQVELAARLGKTQSYVSKIERGELRVDLIDLFEIAEALSVSLEGIITPLHDRWKSGRRPT